jgi:tRNA(Ile)-lysidine synthase
LADVLQEVEGAIRSHDLLDAGDSVVVGVSGGPDSLCLLHVLRRLRAVLDLQLHVAHLNHGARAEAADRDADFVKGIATEWRLPVTVEKRDVPRLAREHSLAFEEAARRVRYSFLAETADRIGSSKIAVGHTGDDQAETVLMHFLRGSGLAGLRGMLPATPITDYRLVEPYLRCSTATARRHVIIRPLLNVPRRAVEAYCDRHELSPRFDRSNLDTTYFRNRLRHELLPELETYNPNIRERLRHTAAVAASDFDLLTGLRQEAWDGIVREEREDTIVFDQAAWQALPLALQRATLRHATYRLRRSLRDVTFVHVENAREIALEGETGKEATLPMGLTLKVGYDTLTIRELGQSGPPPHEPLLWRDQPLPARVPGTTPLPETDWVLEARLLDRWDLTRITSPNHPWTAYFDADALAEPVALRRRRGGDRLQPRGMDGHTVKVSELMINLKIPQAWRDRVPLLVSGEQIIWVCGRRIARSVQVRPETRQVARFRFLSTA